jgi:zona occludens toxin (predicted ATPase)
MINILTGPPRAGKTYFAVKWLLENYIKYDKEKLIYTIKNDALIITNISGLKVPYKNLDDILKENEKDAIEFFSIEVQEELSKKYPTIIYLIDEAHIYFPKEIERKSIASKSLRDYFAFHAHYNQHYWLMTQDTSLIFNSIVKLAETEYQTIRESLRPPGRFRYNMRDPKTKLKFRSITLRKDKTIFPFYSSSENTETERPKRTKAFLYMYSIIAVAVIAFVIFINRWMAFGDDFKGVKKNTVTKIESIGSARPSTQDVKKKINSRDFQQELLMKWVPIATVYDSLKREILVQDDEFGLVTLQECSREFKVHRGRVYIKKIIEKDDKKEAGLESGAAGPASLNEVI